MKKVHFTLTLNSFTLTSTELENYKTINLSDNSTITSDIYNEEDGFINFTGTSDINGSIFNSGIMTMNASSTLSSTTKIENNKTINLSNNSTITSDIYNEEDGSINFTGTSSINGKLTNNSTNTTITFPSGSNTTIEYFNNNVAGTKAVIAAGAQVEILGNGGLALRNMGIFTIESLDMSATGTGLLKTSGTVYGTGTTFVERKVDITTTKWQLISSPLTTVKASVFTGHYLNEYKEGAGEFEAIIDKTKSLVVGEGFVLKWDGTQGVSGTVAEISFTGGGFNHGDRTRVLAKGLGNTYFDLPEGFNLVGNIYPSNLDWDIVYADDDNAGANTANLDATYYYYVDNGHGTNPEDPTPPLGNGINGWSTYTSGVGGVHQNISIGQGFGVVMSDNTDNGSMNIPNDARTFTASNGFNKKQESKSNYFELTAVSNNIIDKIYFEENENSTENFDGKYDAYKLNSFGYSPTPSFVSADGKKLARCVTTQVESIEMGFTMESTGEVVFSLKDVVDFTEIVLEDKKESTFTNLVDEDYTFHYSLNDEEFGRFTLHFNRETLSDKDYIQNLGIYSSNNTLYIKSTENLEDVNVKLFNMNGQKVYENSFSSMKEQKIYTGLNSGIYILEVTSNKGITTQKISLSN